MTREFRSLKTQLIHAGEPEPRIHGAVSLPVFQSSTYEYGGEDSYHDVRYIRLSNTPNHLAVHAKLAAVERTEAALVTASGMAAISAVLLSVLRQGDHVLVQNSLYGGTHSLIHDALTAVGVERDVIDSGSPESWRPLLRTGTRAIYVETMSNPLLRVPDLDAVVGFAREHGLVSIIDNTFATPVNYTPCDHGFDVCIHSGTKYLNGHTDIVAGAVAGGRERVEAALHKLSLLGGALDPHACYLLHRGLKTLALRVAHQNASALEIARFLEAQPRITRVNYPGLESFPDHGLAKKHFAGYGGMMSFELEGGVETAEQLFRRLQIPIVAPSLGGVETLVTRPATTSHAGMSREEREAAGIGDGLIRVSVGIEDTAELIDDFEQALAT